MQYGGIVVMVVVIEVLVWRKQLPWSPNQLTTRPAAAGWSRSEAKYSLSSVPRR